MSIPTELFYDVLFILCMQLYIHMNIFTFAASDESVGTVNR